MFYIQNEKEVESLESIHTGLQNRIAFINERGFTTRQDVIAIASITGETVYNSYGLESFSKDPDNISLEEVKQKSDGFFNKLIEGIKKFLISVKNFFKEQYQKLFKGKSLKARVKELEEENKRLELEANDYKAKLESEIKKSDDYSKSIVLLNTELQKSSEVRESLRRSLEDTDKENKEFKEAKEKIANLEKLISDKDKIIENDKRIKREIAEIIEEISYSNDNNLKLFTAICGNNVREINSVLLWSNNEQPMYLLTYNVPSIFEAIYSDKNLFGSVNENKLVSQFGEILRDYLKVSTFMKQYNKNISNNNVNEVMAKSKIAKATSSSTDASTRANMIDFLLIDVEYFEKRFDEKKLLAHNKIYENFIDFIADLSKSGNTLGINIIEKCLIKANNTVKKEEGVTENIAVNYQSLVRIVKTFIDFNLMTMKSGVVAIRRIADIAKLQGALLAAYR